MRTLPLLPLLLLLACQPSDPQIHRYQETVSVGGVTVEEGGALVVFPEVRQHRVTLSEHGQVIDYAVGSETVLVICRRAGEDYNCQRRPTERRAAAPEGAAEEAREQAAEEPGEDAEPPPLPGAPSG